MEFVDKEPIEQQPLPHLSSVCEEMRGRVSVRLSPNEEAQLERQELHRRRKLRLQQVREPGLI